MARNEPMRRLGAGASSLVALAFGLMVLGCGEAGTSTADNGGVGGTGISQGPIDSFGSIFVNGVEWMLDAATVEVDGVVLDETALRVGMQVRVVGNLEAALATGTANRVEFDTTLQGPVQTMPVDDLPDGSRVRFSLLGRDVVADASGTRFGPGIDFGTIGVGQLIRTSGFVAPDESVRATRIDLVGSFPAADAVEVEGVVGALARPGPGEGIFDLGMLTVRYDATTVFTAVSEADLANGDRIDIEGALRPSGDEIDAGRISAIREPFAGEDLESLELEGFVTAFVSIGDFRVDGVRVDGSAATLEPVDFVVAEGALVEVEGPFVAGVLRATRIENEDDSHPEGESIHVRAAVAAIDVPRQELMILGLTVERDPEVELEDERDELPNFRFEDIVVGDFLNIEGRYVSDTTVRAKKIVREDPEPDVRLAGPVKFLDTSISGMPTMEVAGLTIPLLPTTVYSDETGTQRTQAEFFESPGDISLGSEVEVRDLGAADPAILGEADEVALDDRAGGN